MQPPRQPDDLNPNDPYALPRSDAFDPIPEEEIPFAEVERDLEICWRCGKSVEPERGQCPVCQARLRREFTQGRTTRSRISGPSLQDDLRSVKVVLWGFALLLIVSMIQAWYVHAKLNFGGLLPQQQKRILLDQLTLFSAIDSVLLLIILVLAGSPPTETSPPQRRGLMWALGLPLLAALLGVNLLYHYLINEFVGGVNPNEIVALEMRDHPLLMILLICVQPAIVEELFFRYMALGHLRKVMGEHAAVWVSAVMFGVAHIHVPLSVPVLMTLGMGLGYARLYSGGMVLPMLMHGLHNLIVLLVEANR